MSILVNGKIHRPGDYIPGVPRTCFNCDNCINLGEGTYVCDEHDYTVVMIDYLLIYKEKCRKWRPRNAY